MNRPRKLVSVPGLGAAFALLPISNMAPPWHSSPRKEMKRESKQIIEILIGSPGKSTFPRHYGTATLSCDCISGYLLDGLMYSTWPTFEEQLARLQSGMRAARGFIWQPYCTTQYEILTPITGRRHIIISRSAATADDWDVLVIFLFSAKRGNLI